MAPARSRPFFYRAKSSEKIVALSFDDGPLKRTARIMDLLRKRRVPAAFFILASRLDSRSARLYRDPLFEVGLHGWRHRHYRRLSPRSQARELDRGVRRLQRYGVGTRWFRPPYGEISASLPSLMKRRNLRGVLWSLDSYDWRGYRGTALLVRLRRELRPGSLILLHDQSLPLRDLAALIDTIRGMGYRIVPLSELMKHPSFYP